MKFALTKTEIKLYNRLDTPGKIQDYLDTLKINFEKKGETCNSPRTMIRLQEAHCIEAAFFASSVLWYHGYKPLLLDLVSQPDDYDHVVALFKSGSKWGAISKSNHAVLRWRDPVYSSVRELAMSYFHEYFMDNGKKSMVSFSKPFNLSKFGKDWVTTEESLLYIADALDESPHILVLSPSSKKQVRKVSALEIQAGKLVEWK